MRTTIWSLLAVALGTCLWCAAPAGAEELDEDAAFALELLSCREQPEPPAPLDNPMLPEPYQGEEQSDEEDQETASEFSSARIADFVARCIAWLFAALANGST